VIPKVSIVKTADTGIEDSLNRSIELIGGWERFVTNSDSVLIKPNLFIKESYESGKITHPLLILADCKAIHRLGADIVIAEKTKNIYHNLKDYPEIKTYAHIMSFEEVSCRNITLQEADALKLSIPVPTLMDECNVFINMPSIRTHTLTKISNSLKNMMGILPDTAAFHVHVCGLQRSIADLNFIRKSDLVISDGIYSLHDNFPAAGKPLKTNIIVSGDNAVAVDSVVAEIIGFCPMEIGHIRFAYQRGLGPVSFDDIELSGEPIENVTRTINFIKAPSNLEFIEKKINVIYNNTCDECVAAAASGLTEAFSGKVRMNIEKEKVAVVIGPFEKLPEIKAETIILYGNCTFPYKQLGYHIPGCPPQANMILETIKKISNNQ